MPEFLEKKIAGIPAYVWVVLIVAAIGIGLYLRKRVAASAVTSDTGIPPDDSVAFPGSVGGGSGGGGIIGGGGNGSGGSSDNQAILDALSKLGTDIQTSIASIPIPEIPPLQPPAPPPVQTLPPIPPSAMEPSAAPVSPSAGSPVLSPPAPPTSVATAPPSAPAGPVPGASFTWLFSAAVFHGEHLPAKSTWYIADKPLFLKHLGARGLTYAGWQANHRPAACRVFGDCA